MADDPQKKAQSERAARLQKQIDELVAGNGGRASSNPRAFTDAAAAETKRRAEESQRAAMAASDDPQNPAAVKDPARITPPSSAPRVRPLTLFAHTMYIGLCALLGFIFLGGWGALIGGALAAAASLVDVVKHVRWKRR